MVSNVYDHAWHPTLKTLDVQFLTVSVFKDHMGKTAHEVRGRLAVMKENLGFGEFSRRDNSLRLPKSCGLQLGLLRIEDHTGTLALWTARADATNIWLTKNEGISLFQHGAHVQVIRTMDGRILLREPN